MPIAVQTRYHARVHMLDKLSSAHVKPAKSLFITLFSRLSHVTYGLVLSNSRIIPTRDAADGTATRRGIDFEARPQGWSRDACGHLLVNRLCRGSRPS